ncbi:MULTISPECIES: Fe-S biogenesis protein NfuA [Reinekea]|jgi:Fe/S biogenesis protein NfuA|uniref:Fe/S biogenesis protein NfuA n=1 Tax=Reinekea forsetii TaxID=1336806 RepID=A0A2K8KQS6_9GAMM|nr:MULTISPECIES: Fe-S biogenesis protein NfuA [Reinekea]ATX76409.1 amino acid ABC transporter substrate-binding protein [Reinekea forsetii]
MDIQINITESAQEYLAGLLAKQTTEGMSVRMFVTQPGTKYAETCLAYCRPGEEKDNDERIELTHIKVLLEKSSLPYLDEAEVDYAQDRMGGQLTIKAPNAKMPKVNKDSSLSEQVSYLLLTEINPGLASHGGDVSLAELTEDNVAVLKFGGGCQGCSAVSITLKDGVEKTLLERLPQLTGVRDVTDHTVTENAYFQ